MGNGYTELFFMDDVSALAAGHRPCFECRRKIAKDFCETFAKVNNLPSARVGEVDALLHTQRLAVPHLAEHARLLQLPTGTMIEDQAGVFFAIKDGLALEWSGNGYHKTSSLPKSAYILTPESVIKTLTAGFKPVWHKSATQE